MPAELVPSLPVDMANLLASSVDFRDGMSRVGGAVHIVTTGGKAGMAGFTATAVVSVSDDPPTALVCLQASSRSLPIITGNGVFCINTLGEGDEALADVFAGRSGLVGEARFSAGAWTHPVASPEHLGVPVLQQALVSFECRLIEASRVATHQILIGEVSAVHLGALRSGLIYKNRRYNPL